MERFAIHIEGYGQVTIRKMKQFEKKIINGQVPWENIARITRYLETCLAHAMKLEDAVKYLYLRLEIDPVATCLVWSKLAVQNPKFFKTYEIQLQLQDTVNEFNRLIKIQSDRQKYQLDPPPPSVEDLNFPSHHEISMPELLQEEQKTTLAEFQMIDSNDWILTDTSNTDIQSFFADK